MRSDPLVDLIKATAEKLDDADPAINAKAQKEWALWWKGALDLYQAYKDRECVDLLLAKGVAVPADAAKRLASMKLKRGAPSKVKMPPSGIVWKVRWAIINGNPYLAGDEIKSAADNPAFAAVAAELGVDAGSVKRLYRQVPKKKRDEIKAICEDFADRIRSYGTTGT